MAFRDAQVKAAYAKKWRQDNREVQSARDFAYQLKFNYGLDFDEYLEMLLAQEGKCKCCGVYMTYKTRLATQCCVDHCHATGKVRGLLCSECNKSLGYIESPRFDLLLQYLQRPTVPVFGRS